MLQNKTFTKILSVVIALVLWVYVIGEVNPTTTNTIENIPVKLLNTENLASKGLVVLDGDTFTVNLTVEGKRADILGMDQDNLLVTADLFGYGLGENYINVSVELPQGISLVSSAPSKLKVVIDELITAIKPVSINYVGELEDGVEPGQISIYPESVEVNGARSLVEQVAYVGADIDMATLTTELSTTSADAYAYNVNGEIISKVKLATETIAIGARLMRTKVVPLLVEVVGQELPELQVTNIEIPETVVIRGDKNVVDKVDQILAKNINLSDYTVSAEIPLEVFLPEGVELAEASKTLVAKIAIKGLSSKSFEYNTSVIQIEGLAEGFAAEIIPSNLIVSVVEKDSVLKEITSTDLDITINLEGLGLGAHQVNLVPSINGNTDNITIGPTSVTVNIHALQ